MNASGGEEADSLYQQAMIFRENGDTERALRYFTKAIKADTQYVNAYWYRGGLYGDAEKYELAIKDLQTVNELVPDYAPAYGDQGWYLILQGKVIEARKPLQRAIELDPEEMAYTVNYGHTHLLCGDTATARQYYQRTLSLLKSETEFRSGPLIDFEIFTKKGWQVEACKQYSSWMNDRFEAYYGPALQRADSLRLEIARLTEADEYGQAISLSEELLKLCNKIREPIHTDIANAQRDLATLYHLEEKFQRAEQLYQDAIEIFTRIHGSEHLDIAEASHYLGLLYMAQNQYVRAEPLLVKALEIRQKKLNPEHSDIVSTSNNLAQVYRALGEYDKAESYYQQALQISKNIRDAEDLDLAVDIYNLAEFYFEQGKHVQAKPLFEEALEIFRKNDGDEQTWVPKTMHQLAEIFKIRGDYRQAESLYQNSLAIYRQIYGSEDLNVAASLNSLAGLYGRQGRYRKAEVLYDEALTITIKLEGTEHPDVATCLNNLSLVYYDLGQYSEGISLAKKALEIRRKSLDGEHPDIASSLRNLAGFYQIQGCYSEAEPLLEQAIEIYKKALGVQHPAVANSLNNLAELYRKQGRYDEAEHLFQQAIEIFETALGSRNIHISTALNNLGALYRDQEEYLKAAEHYQAASEIFKARLGAGHSTYAASLDNLADIYRELAQYPQAVSLHRQALKIRIKAYGKEHPDVANSLNNLAVLFREQKRFEKAESTFFEVLAILKKNVSSEHPHMIRCLNNLAMVYWDQNKLADAEPYFQQVNSKLTDHVLANFPGLSESEKEKFFHTLDETFEVFLSFAIERYPENPSITIDMFNNQLVTKALLLNNISKVKRLILNSGKEELINLYNAWILQKEYLAQLYTLSEAQAAERGINRDSLETATNALEKQLSRQSQAFSQAADTTLYNWKNIQGALRPDEAAIEVVRFYLHRRTWTDTVYYAALIVTPETKDYPEMVVLENGNELEGKYFNEYLRCRKIKNKIPYQQYWQPVKEKLGGINKVHFSPDGIYNQINLNILYNAGTQKYLVDEIDIHLVTNTKDLLQFEKDNNLKKEAKLFGRPSYSLELARHTERTLSYQDSVKVGTVVSDKERTLRQERGRSIFDDLEGSEDEVKQIDTLLINNKWRSTVYIGPDALEEAVKSVDNPGVLHIATHGFFVPEDTTPSRVREQRSMPFFSEENRLVAPVGVDAMLRSGLVLAGAKSYLDAEEKPDTEDGILTAYEAANLDLDNTELVVLSACETGLGEVRNGEGVYGLQRAFKVAGAETILMSLWKVDDTATRELMTTFYEEWLKTGNKRQAFRKAQQQIREKYQQPEYWGAFVMVGE